MSTILDPQRRDSRLWAWWNWLTQPHQDIQDIGLRRQVRWILTIEVLFLPLILIGALSSLNIDPISTYFLLFALVVLFLSYLVSRTRHYTGGTLLFMGALTLLPFMTAYFYGEYDYTGLTRSFVWLGLPIVLGSMLLSAESILYLGGFHTVGLFMFVWMVPEAELSNVMHLVGFVISVTIITAMATRHRDLVELDRLKIIQANTDELAQTNARLQDEIARHENTQDSLRESERRFRKMADHTAAAIIIYQEGQVRYANPAAHQLGGTTPADRVGVNGNGFAAQLLRHLAPISASVTASDTPAPVRIVVETSVEKDEHRWVDLTANQIEFEGETAVLVTAFDVTEGKRAEAEAARAYDQLAIARDELESRVQERTAALEQMKDDMETLLYIVSHDLKEPLRAIQGFSRLVNQRYLGQLDEKGQDFLQRIDRAAQRLYELIDAILNLSRVQRMALPAEMVDCTEIVHEALSGLEDRIQNTEAVVTIAPELPVLPINRTWATQAVFNLISNALKFTQADVTPNVTIEAYDGPEGVGLAVLDRGPGVSPEHAERMFQLFQRGVGREIEGTGAGLAIVRQVARRHGGHAWVEPREGGGAAFFMTLQAPPEAVAIKVQRTKSEIKV